MLSLTNKHEMAYSQKPLIDLMKKGQVPGESGIPRHIETVISNVFLFDKNAYKIYKNDNDFFNKEFRDISGKEERFTFTRGDFAWNNKLSPSIYLKLMGIRVAAGEIEFLEPVDEADDLVIFMNRVDSKDFLVEKLMRGEITEKDAFSIGRQLGETLGHLKAPKVEGQNYYELFESRIKDMREWIKMVNEYISEEESGAYCDFLENFRNKNKGLLEGTMSDELAHSGDLHSHNAVFTGGKLHLVDTFPPKEEWLIQHRMISVYRMGSDIWALSGDKNLFESYIKGYEEGSGIKVDRNLDVPFVIYASSIMVSYLYMLQRTDPKNKESALRFHKFIREYFAEVKNK